MHSYALVADSRIPAPSHRPWHLDRRPRTLTLPQLDRCRAAHCPLICLPLLTRADLCAVEGIKRRHEHLPLSAPSHAPSHHLERRRRPSPPSRSTHLLLVARAHTQTSRLAVSHRLLRFLLPPPRIELYPASRPDRLSGCRGEADLCGIRLDTGRGPGQDDGDHLRSRQGRWGSCARVGWLGRSWSRR